MHPTEADALSGLSIVKQARLASAHYQRLLSEFFGFDKDFGNPGKAAQMTFEAAMLPKTNSCR